MKKLALILALCLLVECVGLSALAEEPAIEEFGIGDAVSFIPEEEIPAGDIAAAADHFEEGYVYVNGGTVVYTNTAKSAQAGTLTFLAVAYAVNVEKAEDPRQDWLQIRFVTEAGEVTGYVQAKDVTPLTAEEADALQNILPVAEFAPYQAPAAEVVEPAAQAEPEVVEPAAEEPAEQAEPEAVEPAVEEPAEPISQSAPEDYVVRADGTILEYLGQSTAITLPLQVGGITVTRLSEAVFANNSLIKSVTMPNNIQVDDGAFRNCTSLLSVSMHNSITYISAECFEGCTSLQSVSWPENLFEIGHDAFSGCISLTGVPSGTNLTVLGDNAFKNCTSLTYADLPASLAVIGQGAFANCINLQEIVLPDAVTQMGNHAFENCSSAKKLKLSNGLTIINNYCFSGCGAITEIVIPASVTEIGREAFLGCSGAWMIRLHGGVLNIGNSAFAGRNSTSWIRWDDCQGAGAVYLGADALGSSGNLLAPLNSAAHVYAKSHTGIKFVNTLIRDYVERCYNIILGRASEERGLLDWCLSIATTSAGGAGIVKNFIDSAEFRNRKLDNSGTLDVLYRAMLNREPDSAKNDWMAVLGQGMTFDRVMWGFAASDEFKALCNSYQMQPGTIAFTYYRDKNPGLTAYVARMYEKCLKRAFDPNGLESWCKNVLTGKTTAAAVATGFFMSPEYAGKGTTNMAFLQDLYETLFNRVADTPGLNAWLTSMNRGMKRQQVINGFTASVEFDALLKSFGLPGVKPKKK